jgi:hypothetical protein
MSMDQIAPRACLIVELLMIDLTAAPATQDPTRVQRRNDPARLGAAEADRQPRRDVRLWSLYPTSRSLDPSGTGGHDG